MQPWASHWLIVRLAKCVARSINSYVYLLTVATMPLLYGLVMSVLRLVLWSVIAFLVNCAVCLTLSLRVSCKPKWRGAALLVVAHPDDECMFFTPALQSCSGRNLHVLCLSNGGAAPCMAVLCRQSYPVPLCLQAKFLTTVPHISLHGACHRLDLLSRQFVHAWTCMP